MITADTFEADSTLFAAKYIGKDGIVGFKRFSTYMIKLLKTMYGYEVEATENITEGDYCDNLIQYASMKSVEQNWKKV